MRQIHEYINNITSSLYNNYNITYIIKWKWGRNSLIIIHLFDHCQFHFSTTEEMFKHIWLIESYNPCQLWCPPASKGLFVCLALQLLKICVKFINVCSDYK